jgi:hypothetical protein
MSWCKMNYFWYSCPQKTDVTFLALLRYGLIRDPLW